MPHWWWSTSERLMGKLQQGEPDGNGVSLSRQLSLLRRSPKPHCSCKGLGWELEAEERLETELPALFLLLWPVGQLVFSITNCFVVCQVKCEQPQVQLSF